MNICRNCGYTEKPEKGEVWNLCFDCHGENWRKDEVTDVSTVEEFCQKYYKYERYTGRGKEYAEVCLNSHKEDFNKQGWTILSRHESVTGKVVAFFNKDFISQK